MRDIERHKKAKALKDSGMKMKEIATIMGVGISRVRDMLNHLAYSERKQAWEKQKADEESKDPSLIPWSRGLPNKIVLELARHGFNSRNDCMRLAADELAMYRGSVVLPGWEEGKDYWRGSDKKLRLAMVNEVRIWLGVAVYTPPASDKGLDRAKKLLERHGWKVEPPNAELTCRQRREEKPNE